MSRPATISPRSGRFPPNRPVRVVCDNPNLHCHGLFGTVVGGEHSSRIEPGNLLDVIWLDYPDEGAGEIDGGNLKVVSEGTYQIELMERRIDAYLDEGRPDE